MFTPEKRSWVMSRIRGTDTKIEVKMKKLLSGTDCKFKTHPKMYGNPDFVIEKKKIAIFCDGDFWHGYKYDAKKKPPKKFWKNKIETNIKRDRKISRRLRSDGWSVLRFWEHEIEKRPETCERKILRFVNRKLTK